MSFKKYSIAILGSTGSIGKTSLKILEQYPNAILTIPQNILSHLHVSPLLNIFDVPVKLPQMNIGIFWHKNLMENKRNHFLRNEIYKIFA